MVTQADHTILCLLWVAHRRVQNLDTVFPVAWAHGKLQAMLASGDDAEKILQWIDENVSKEASRDEEFAQRLTRLFLDFVAARTKSISEQDKVLPHTTHTTHRVFGDQRFNQPTRQVAEEETKLFEQYAPLLKKFLSDSQAQVDCLSVVQRFCFEQDFPEGPHARSALCSRSRTRTLTLGA